MSVPFAQHIPRILMSMSSRKSKSPSQLCAHVVRSVPSLRADTSLVRMLRLAMVLLAGWHLAFPTQAQVYVGVLGGVATLSGDSRSLLSPGSVAFSSYDPNACA